MKSKFYLHSPLQSDLNLKENQAYNLYKYMHSVALRLFITLCLV